VSSDRERFIVFGRPALQEPEIEELVATLRSGWLSTGPRVARFEREFAGYKAVEQAVAVNSCTAALHLSLVVCGIGPGDEVITTGLTFCSTVNAIIHAGGTPVIADVEPTTMNIDVADVERRITPKTRAVLIVHFAGRPCRMEPLVDLTRRQGLRLIEDCAHAVETETDLGKAGTIGDFGCFSFYATKNVTTGEGGMVLAREASELARIRTLALHGLSRDAWKRFSDSGYKHYEVTEPGFKYNMMDIQAALGIWQLQRVEENWRRRDAIWERYLRELGGLPLELPSAIGTGERHARHLFTVIVRADAPIDRDGFMAELTKEGVGVGVHYNSIATHPYYQDAYGWRPEDYPHSHRIGRQTVSLPLSPDLSDQEQSRVVAAVRKALGFPA
jgi:dTDP-4-amino-4,6-dideoxygalactose transaminase